MKAVSGLFWIVFDGRQIVVLDEAYFEFVEKDDFPDGIRLLREYPNLVVFRTFSKMYALAGLRIGYLAGDRQVVDTIRKTCVVYSVNALAQETALAALKDPEHLPADPGHGQDRERLFNEGTGFAEASVHLRRGQLFDGQTAHE